MSHIPTPLLARLLPFRPFAERLGVEPDVLRQDDACPPLVTIGGVEHIDLAALARFEVALLIRAYGEECEVRRARLARRRAEPGPSDSFAGLATASEASGSEPEPVAADPPQHENAGAIGGRGRRKEKQNV